MNSLHGLDYNEQDYYEEPDEDMNQEEQIKPLLYHSSTSYNTNIDSKTKDPTEVYKKILQTVDKQESNKNNFYITDEKEDDTTTEQSKDDNPLSKFMRIKNEIDLIEKDLKFYESNKDCFPSKDVSIEDTIKELERLKQFANYIYNSPNFEQIKKIITTQNDNKLNIPKKKIQVLNKEIYSKLNSHLLNRVKIINKLKAENPKDLNDIEFELYVSPDTSKVKQIKKLNEIKKSIKSIEEKLGNCENIKMPITNLLKNLQNSIQVFDKDFTSNIKEKLEKLQDKLSQIKLDDKLTEKMNIEPLEKIMGGFKSSKECEELIYNTISKMETLKNDHEQSAFISLKIKELLDQQEKISDSIDENTLILDNLNKNIKDNVQAMKKNIEVIKAKLKK